MFDTFHGASTIMRRAFDWKRSKYQTIDTKRIGVYHLSQQERYSQLNADMLHFWRDIMRAYSYDSLSSACCNLPWNLCWYSLHKQLHILLCDEQLAGGGEWVSAPAPLLATLAETLTCNKTQHNTLQNVCMIHQTNYKLILPFATTDKCVYYVFSLITSRHVSASTCGHFQVISVTQNINNRIHYSLQRICWAESHTLGKAATV
jgi:hypothetical protein